MSTASPQPLVKFGVADYAHAAYQAAGPSIGVPYRRHPRRLSRNQKIINSKSRPQPGARRTRRRHAEDLEAADQAVLLPRRATPSIAAITVLQPVDDQH